MAIVDIHSARGELRTAGLARDGTPPGVGEAISPELVLVSPELREQALRDLPDRLWEAFLPSEGVTHEASPRVAATGLTQAARSRPIQAPLADLPRPGSVGRGLPVLMAPEQTAPRDLRRRRDRRWVRTATKVATVAAMLVGVGTLGVWDSGGERLLPRVTPTRPPSDTGAPPAYRSGAYLIGTRGWLQTGQRGRAITELQLPVFCNEKQVALGRIPIQPDGRFRFSGRARDGRFRVTLVGRFMTISRARAEVAVQGPGCRNVTKRFLARVT